MTHVSGSNFVLDGTGPRGWGRLGDGAALDYEHNGERYDTLTMAGCADCTVSGNSLISFNRERPPTTTPPTPPSSRASVRAGWTPPSATSPVSTARRCRR